jgi:hypothetical protein
MMRFMGNEKFDFEIPSLDVSSRYKQDSYFLGLKEAMWHWSIHLADRKHRDEGDHSGLLLALVERQNWKLNYIQILPDKDPLREKVLRIPIEPISEDYEKSKVIFYEQADEFGLHHKDMDGAILIGIDRRVMVAGAQLYAPPFDDQEIPVGGGTRHTVAQAASTLPGYLMTVALSETYNMAHSFENGKRTWDHNPADPKDTKVGDGLE